METGTFLERIRHHNFFNNQIVCVEELPERPPVYQDVPGGLHEAVEKALDRLGIEKLYSHQATAIEKIRQGKNVVNVTGTASGKTLCYTIPVIEA